MTPEKKKACITVTVISWSHDFYNNARYFYEELKEIIKKKPYKEKYHPYLQSCILFSFLCIEAYINEILDRIYLDLKNKPQKSLSIEEKLFRKYFKNERRLSIEDKILICTKILTGRTLDVYKEPYNDFKKLKEVRDKLVHLKTGEYPKLNFNRAKISVKAMIRTLEKLHKIYGQRYPDIEDPRKWDNFDINSL